MKKELDMLEGKAPEEVDNTEIAEVADMVDAPEGGEASEEEAIVEEEVAPFDPNEYLKGRYPDVDPSEYPTRLDELFAKNDEYGQNMKTMEEIFGEDHMLEQVILNMKDGMPFSIALVKAGFTPEDFPVEGDDDYETYKEELNSRKEKSTAAQAKLEELMANSESTNAAYMEVMKELFDGDDDGASEFQEFIRNQASMYNSNKMSADDLKNAHRYKNIDKLIADAYKEGEISGSNKSIADRKATEEMGDEIPDLTGAGDRGNLEQPEEESYYRGEAVKF